MDIDKYALDDYLTGGQYNPNAEGQGKCADCGEEWTVTGQSEYGGFEPDEECLTCPACGELLPEDFIF